MTQSQNRWAADFVPDHVCDCGFPFPGYPQANICAWCLGEKRDISLFLRVMGVEPAQTFSARVTYEEV